MLTPVSPDPRIRGVLVDTTSPSRYSTVAVCREAGVTYRQLDYWIRLGLLAPSLCQAHGSGTRSAFSALDVAVVKILGAVGGHGVPLNRLDQLVGFLTDLPLQQWAATSIVLDVNGDVWLSDSAAPKIGLHVDLSLVFDSVAV